MKQPTNEAARALGLHPANLLLHLAHMGADFHDVWPEIEDYWIENLRQQDWERFARQPGATHQPAPAQPASLGISEAAALIVEKLYRKGKWGVATVTVEAIQHMVHLSGREVDVALEELLSVALLSREGRQFSLDSARRAEVTRIAEHRIEHRTP